MDDLLKDAIADAKAVRETALQNAKIALEEAFTPRIQSMLSQKIQSEIEDEDDADEAMHGGDDHDEEEEAPEAPVAPEAPEAEAPEVAVEPEEGEEAADIADEIDDEDEAMHGGDDHDEEAGEDSDEGYDESKVIEIDGVKYAPVVSEEEEDADEGEGEEDEDEGYNEDLDLESILRELEEETVTEEEDDEDETVKEEEDKDEGEEVDEEVNENDVSSEIGAADNKVKPEAGDSSKIGQGPEGEGSDKESGKEDANLEVVDDLTEDIDLEEVLKALTEEEDDDADEEKEKEVEEQVKALQDDLNEHRNVVKYLRGKLNEVNLLNAKLLFTNKLFRNYGLSNEQKLKVVETFDRATNLREVKLVFSTLAESFGNVAGKPKTKSIQESKGSASKAVASTKPKTEEVISEGFEMKERFQKLAKIL